MGGVIGSINIVDGDEYDEYSYSLSGNDANSFEISTEGELKLKDNVTPDIDNKTDYQLEV